MSITVSLLSGNRPDDCELLIGVDDYHYEGEGQVIHSDELTRLIGEAPARTVLDRLHESAQARGVAA